MNKKIISLLIIFLVFLSFLSTYSYKMSSDIQTNQQEEILDPLTAKALMVFASARALNGAISVIQESEVTVSMGAGASIALGQILDPLNDLLEQFADVLLIGLVALKFQDIAIYLANSYFFDGLLSIFAALSLLALYRYFDDSKQRFFRIFIALVLLKVAFPLGQTINTTIDSKLFKGYEKDRLELVAAKERSEKISEIVKNEEQKKPEDDSFSSVIKNGINYLDQKFRDTKENIEKFSKYLDYRYLEKNFEKASDSLINLIIQFSITTILFPIFWVFGIYQLLRMILFYKS